MSFCHDIKNELGTIRPSACCKLPLTYGFLLFSRYFSSKKISMQTENESAAKLYSKLLTDCYGVNVEMTSGGGKKPTFRAFVPNEFDRLKILASVDFGIADGKINRESLKKDCCSAAFIRGAFLACGQLSDPNIAYRLDFSVKDKNLAEEFRELLSEHNIGSSIAKRGSGFVVYIKQNETISDLLTLIGASTRSLELIETTIIKNLKNNMNRARNCDSANISKSVNASLKQRKAIEYLQKNDMLSFLPDQLLQAAELRMKDPFASVSQLVEISDEPITVAALSYRLRKLVSIYEQKINNNH